MLTASSAVSMIDGDRSIRASVKTHLGMLGFNHFIHCESLEDFGATCLDRSSIPGVVIFEPAGVTDDLQASLEQIRALAHNPTLPIIVFTSDDGIISSETSAGIFFKVDGYKFVAEAAAMIQMHK